VPALAIINANLSGTSQTGGFFVGNLAGVSGDLGTMSYNIQTTVNKAANTGAVGYYDGSATWQTGTFNTADSYTAVRVSAPAGSAMLNFGYESRKNTTAASTVFGNIDYSNMVLSAALPVTTEISLNAAYARTSVRTGNVTSTLNGGNAAAEGTGYILGASYKVSDALGFGLTVAQNDAASSAKMMAFSGQYNFSGSTTLYANVADFTNAGVLNNAGHAGSGAFALSNATAYSGKLVSVGLQHSF